MIFAENAEIVVNAVKSYAKRYAAQAKARDLTEWQMSFQSGFKSGSMNNMRAAADYGFAGKRC